LYDGRFPFAVLDLDERESLRAVELCNFRQFVGLTDSDSGEAFGVDRFHHAARIEPGAKNFETAFAKNFSEIDKLHSKATIRFVAAVSADCLAISEPIERRFNLDVEGRFKNRRQHSLSECENVIRRNERGFDVDLRELRLPVGAQVFVAKTFRDLKIFFHAGYHQQLFVLLRRLRQRVEFSGRIAARDQKVPRAFRRTLGKDWGFHFYIPLAVEIIARCLHYTMAHAQVARETWPTQIEVPVRHP